MDVATLSSDQVLYIEHLFHLFLLHSLSSPQLKRNLTRIMDEDQLELVPAIFNLKIALRESAEINCYYKLGFIKYLQGQPRYLREMGIGTQRIARMMRKHPIRGVPKPAIRDLSPQHQRELYERIEPELNRYIRNYVSYKQKFIAKSQRSLEMRDLQHDLATKAIVAFRWLYPYRDENHIIPATKQSIHNAGVNEIKAWTTQKRGRFVKNAHGDNEARVVNLEALDVPENNSWQTITSGGLSGSGETVSWNDIEQRQSLESLLMRLRPQYRRAILLLSTSDPPSDFIEFLERRLETRIIDYEDFLPRLRVREDKMGLTPFTLLRAAVAAYCDITDERMEKLVKFSRNLVFD